MELSKVMEERRSVRHYNNKELTKEEKKLLAEIKRELGKEKE